MKTRTTKVIEVDDWDELVKNTYGRIYSFQQQDDCKSRGVEHISVPCNPCDYENDTIPEIVNGIKMGVSFKAWLERDPTQRLTNIGDQDEHSLELWWERNFYPHVSMIINDLHEKGLIEAGEYMIEIDW